MGRINNINRYKQTELTGETIILGSRKPFGETVNYDINDIAQYISQFIEGGGTTPMNQNNKVILRNAFFEGSDKIEDRVNAQEPFEVKEDEIFIFVTPKTTSHHRTDGSTITTTVTLGLKYWLFKKGKGWYGVGEDLTTTNDFFLLKETNELTFPTEDPIVYSIITTVPTDPADAVNNSSDSYNIVTGTDVYFYLVNNKGIEQAIYRFVGNAGLYGNGGDLAVSGDFLLIEDFNNYGGDSVSKTSDLLNDGETGQAGEKYITNLDLPSLTNLQKVTDNGSRTTNMVTSSNSFRIGKTTELTTLGGLYNSSDDFAYLELGNDTDDSFSAKFNELLWVKGGYGYRISLEGDGGLPLGNQVYRLPLRSGRLMTEADIKSKSMELETAYPDWGIGIGDSQDDFNTKSFSEIQNKIDKSGGTMEGDLKFEQGASLTKESGEKVVNIISPTSLNSTSNNTGAIVISHPYTVSGRIQMEVSVSKRMSSEDRKEKYFISFSVENGSTIGSQDLQAICITNNEDIKTVKVGFEGSNLVVVIDDDLISTLTENRRVTVDNVVVMGNNADDVSWRNQWETNIVGNISGYNLTGVDTTLITSSVAPSPTVEEHNDLIGLQGGAANEYFHLTSEEYANLGGRVIIPLIAFTLPSSTTHPATETFAPVDILDICPIVDMNYVDWEITWKEGDDVSKLSGNKDFTTTLKWSSGKCFQLEGFTAAANNLAIRLDMNPKLILYY